MMTNYEENESDPCRSADTIPPQTEPNGYQQALEDFCITELLEKLSHFTDSDFDTQSLHPEPEELESVAALLIQQLTNSLNGKLLGSYLNAHRQGNSDVFTSPISLEWTQSVSLPSDFPDSALPPHFLYGDRVRLVPVSSDRESGVVIGRFYNYAAHRGRWMWRYILWLSQASLSASWIVATTAFEEDLEPEVEEVL